MLFKPEELGWIADFTAEMAKKVPERRWTSLLHAFVQMGVAIPGHCGCDPKYPLDWLHLNHAEYNTRIRAAIIATPGARAALYKSLYRDVNGPHGYEVACGRVVLRSYGRELLDFLRVEPTMGWFKQPTLTGRLYQGGALAEQGRSPGLAH